jgi:hypothetical protein
MRRPGRRAGEKPSPEELVHDEPAVAQREPAATPMRDIQRYAGNRAVSALLNGGGSGQALDPGVRADMQHRLGADFSGVRVHRGAAAEQAASSLDARAFTVGSDVVFGAGAYDPGSVRGQQTLAHELTHVIQQRGAAAGASAQAEGLTVSDPNDRFEREATGVAAGIGDHAGVPTAGPMIQREPAGAAPAVDMTAPAEPFMLGEIRIATYRDAALATTLWMMRIQGEADELTAAGLAVPADLPAVIAAGRANAEIWAGGEAEPFDRGNAQDLRAWYDNFVRVINAARGAQAAEASRRAQAAADELRRVEEALKAAEPMLRERQRAAFRAGDEDGLLETADTIATVVDTALITKEAIDKTMEVAAELRAWAGSAGAGRSIADASARVSKVLEVTEKLNKWYAAFQLARAALDLASDGKTESASGHAAVSAMSTVISAGGTLLGASAIFTVYSNLYIGPMVSACLSAIKRLEDTMSRTQNRTLIALGDFDLVNWSLEPGGRAMFDYMLRLMKAGSAADTPLPPGKVSDYLVDNEDDFEAGAIGKDEMPMTGHWFWRDTDDAQIRTWLFRHRRDMWGMLYGDCPIPN